jgi:hypothetical protein
MLDPGWTAKRITARNLTADQIAELKIRTCEPKLGAPLIAGRCRNS